ncbi:MAG TPA: S41 family peptidase [Bacillota bacterium]
MKKARQRMIVVSTLIFITVGAFGWWWQGNVRQGRYKDLPAALYIMTLVKFNYYQQVSLPGLFQSYMDTGNISGMLKSLQDPYTEFLDENDFAELRKVTTGSFGGIGIYLPEKGDLIITGVVKGSPGEKAGLKVGDRIIAINRVPVGKPAVAIAKIRGEAGTRVLLRIVRGDGANRREVEVSIVRSQITIPTVELKFTSDPVMGRYAYLRIDQFAETTASDLESRLREIDNTPDCAGIMLDLRANPGGLLDSAVDVTSNFLPKGTPVLHIYHRGRLFETKRVVQPIPHKKLPMVTLVDYWTASASEIVAGALKDQKRSVLVGTHTFGKDLIQEVKGLPGGVGVKITVFNYLTSGKVNIHKKGVQPDRVVEIPGAVDRLLKTGDSRLFYEMEAEQQQAALELLREKAQARARATVYANLPVRKAG